MKIENFVESIINEYLNEQVSKDTLKNMKAFGLGKNDIDGEGYVTLYHGGKELPDSLKEDEIFYMTSFYDEALDYAKMRRGEVFEIKVNPEDVNWNQGSYEIEFDKGGLIRNGKIIPKFKDKSFEIKSYNEIKNSYSLYQNISDELFKWVERTLKYYISNKKMKPIQSHKQLIDDIDYYYMMDEEDEELIEFAKLLKYSDTGKLIEDLSDILILNFNDVFYEN